jgi:hypothetical protein
MKDNRKNLIGRLWNERYEILDIRSPKWILRYIWTIPIVAGIPIIISNMQRIITAISSIVALLFVAYSGFVYIVWSKWPSRGNRYRQVAVITIMGYDGLLLGCFAILFLITTNVSLRWLNPDWIIIGTILSISLYLILGMYIWINGYSIIQYLLEGHERPLPPQSKLALIVPSLILGAGVAFGSIIRRSQIGLLMMLGLGYLVPFSLLPFSTLAFFQVYLLGKNMLSE